MKIYFLLNYDLPVEAQEIDRLIKVLADKYHQDNPIIYPSSGIIILINYYFRITINNNYF